MAYQNLSSKLQSIDTGKGIQNNYEKRKNYTQLYHDPNEPWTSSRVL